MSNKYHSEFNVWLGIIDRCENKQSWAYKWYGKRGIKICKEWRNSFQKFLEDMGPRPTSKHTIDRINNNGDYKPNNCRWATRKEQARNRRNNRLITYKGETKCMTEWAEVAKLPTTAFESRLDLGWTMQKIMETPLKINKKYEHNGEMLSIKQWADKTGIYSKTLVKRLEQGWSFSKAITTPTRSYIKRNNS